MYSGTVSSTQNNDRAQLSKFRKPLSADDMEHTIHTGDYKNHSWGAGYRAVAKGSALGKTLDSSTVYPQNLGICELDVVAP